MTERYSHPAEDGKPAVHLTDHLEDVAERFEIVVPETQSTPFGSSLREIGRRVGYVHDAGKLTTWFQTHIHGDNPSGPSHHSPLGALLAFHVLDETSHTSEECLAGFVAVAKHHGTLPDTAEYVFDRTAWNYKHQIENQQREAIIDQVIDIDDHARSLAETVVRDASDGETTWAAFADAVRSKSLFERVATQVSNRSVTTPRIGSVSEEFYQCALQLWSALVLADKTSAANAPRAGFDHDRPSRDVLTEYIAGLSDGNNDVPTKEAELNEYRRSARSDVLDSVDEFVANDEQIATLTLPTGMGKTLTGLDAALKIRDETERDRIIYALPFTSIIDQVVAELETIFDTDGTDSLLTVHHHLTDTVVRLEDAFDGVDDETDQYAHIAEMLGESWRSGMVVSTFVQLFESLAGPKNTQSMKLPALYNSVIILDEPQSLPHDWWPLVSRLVEILTIEYNAVVIAMTATQPQLFGEHHRELIGQPKTYFEYAERIEYTLDESFDAYPDTKSGPLSYDEAATTLIESTGSNEDVLAICNTIDSASRLTESLQSQCSHVNVGQVLRDILADTNTDEVREIQLADQVAKQNGAVSLIHLTTRIRPCDRAILIDTIKELTKRERPVCVVSTQLIEAGVDVSFDRVFRDIAPIANVVQAAGRCNRSFEREQGIVTLWWLDVPDDQNDTPAVAVYERWGDSLLSVTKGVFEWIRDDDSPHLDEPSVAWDGVREYYYRLAERRVGNEEYVIHVENGLAETLGELSLIDQRLAIEVFVCRTDKEYQRIEEIKCAWNQYEFDRVRELMDKLAETRVSIPIYSTESEKAHALSGLSTVYEETDIRWIDTRDPRHESYFDAMTGLVAESSVENRFL